MNRRKYLALLTALVVGGYLAASELLPDGSSANTLFDVSRTERTGTYGVGGYGTGEYGE